MTQLDLAFAPAADGRTDLARRRLSYPWALTQPFYLDRVPAGMATVIPQSSAGGLFAGDRLVQAIEVCAGAAAHVTTQGATVVHAGNNGHHAESVWRLTVAAGGCLEVLGDPLVLFPDADLRQRIEIEAAGECVYADGIGWHPEAAFRRYAATIEIRRAGKLLALDRVDIAADDVIREQAATSRAIGGMGLMLFLNVDAKRLVGPLRDAAGDAWTGIGTLPNDAGLVARSIVARLGDVMPLHQRLWRAYRETTTGIAPADRRRGI
ncbi:MAG: urease accessory protein UreD [Alphaproteobacteria bacterium]